MAASDYIGNVKTIYINSVDSNSKEYQTNISKSFTVKPDATYTQVDEAMRALNALSTNTYQDTILVTEISVNMELKE